MRALARWSFTHRCTVLAAWLVALIAVTLIHSAAGSAYRDSFRLHGTDSFDALELLRTSAPKAAGDTDRIVVATKEGKLTDPATEQRIKQMLANVAKQPHVASIGKPAVSPNGQIGFVTFNFDIQANRLQLTDIKRVVKTAKQAETKNLQVELGGQAIENANPGGTGGTAPGFLAAAVVLFLVFGSLLSMLLPLLTAGFALGAGIAAIGLLSHAIATPEFSSELSLLIGLGVGVDYALFIVTRHRQGLLRGNNIEDAAVDAVDTAGRAVLFAGMTVCIALLGMFALGVSFLYGVAIAASLVVAFTVIAALTLLPAMLGFFGLKILRRKERRALAGNSFSETDESPAWGRWARRLERHPALLAAAAAIFMLVLATPFSQPPPRQRRPGQRPHQHHHATGLRPAGQGLRPRLQRPAPARGQDAHGAGQGRLRARNRGRGWRARRGGVDHAQAGRRRRNHRRDRPRGIAPGRVHHQAAPEPARTT